MPPRMLLQCWTIMDPQALQNQETNCSECGRETNALQTLQHGKKCQELGLSAPAALWLSESHHSANSSRDTVPPWSKSMRSNMSPASAAS